MEPPPVLDRRFGVVAFDWDGTAVATRAEDAAPVREPIERLLRCGVLVVVVTGTNLGNLDGQLARAIRGRHKRNLYLATNRGSEVYGFDDESAPELRWKRTATPDEDRALTASADAVAAELRARSGLQVRVIHDRLNRRKVDLIPLAEWSDPPKSALGELLLAVESRLRGAGISGGVREVIELAQQVARAKGLPEARVTSDVKHVEIGLTDKADAARWIVRELAGPHGIAVADILIGGDEFGPIAGFPGSDSRMLVAEAAGATVVSVGPEPGGVPDGVLHLGGGPPRFRELLGALAARCAVVLPATPERDPAWVMIEEGFPRAREHEIESLFAIGNGLVGSRASLAEGSSMSSPATFLAGAFVTRPGAVELARLPDWARWSAAVDGNPLRLDEGEILEHRRILDLRQGILWRHWRQRDRAGRITRLEEMRLASLADRRLLLQSVAITPENYGGVITIEVEALSGATPLAAVTRIEDPEARAAAPSPIAPAATERWTLDVELGRTHRVDRIARVRRSPEPEDLADQGPGALALAVDAHRAAWRTRWDASDVAIDGDPEAQRAIRFAVYHLLSAANPDDDHVSIGARALTGAAYRGHVFWDTEIFMLPFFVLTWPEVARALLGYRYHTLPAARARAARAGHRGALYAWESTDTGDDVTPSRVIAPTGEIIQIRNGEEEQHISADVAHAVWRYWQATSDQRFLVDAGAEILIETARFWASRARPEADGRYHIRRVIGPDEYHESVDDDAYTNGMAQWNLEIAVEAVALLAARWPDRWRELSRRLAVSGDEPGDWRRIAEAMYLGLDPRTGVFEQFQGYFALENIDLRAHEPRTAPIDVLLGRERIQRSQIIKQPDVVMLLYLLGDRFSAAIRSANFRYYEPRTSHGSSLSPPIHAAVAAQLGDVELAASYFRQTAEIDLANRMGNAAGGVHAAALGGLWQAVVFGFAGLTLSEEGPRVHPRLPAGWRAARFAIQWRGTRVPFEVTS